MDTSPAACDQGDREMSTTRTIRRLLRTKNTFVSDMQAPGMVHCLTVRSEKACARIIRVLAPDLGDDIILVTAADIPGRNSLEVNGESMPILAADIVRYVGEPIALIAGPDLRKLRKALDSVKITYEELEAHLGFEVHDPEQVYAYKVRQLGDPEAALSAAYHIVEGEYRTGAQEHLYSEPQGAFATWDDEKRITVHTPTQWPFHVHRTVAEVLGVPIERVRVRGSEIGLAMDGKLWYPSLLAAHAALITLKTDRPVSMLYSREEDFLFTSKRAPAFVRHVSGLDQNGNVTAMKISISFNAGAYPLFTLEMLDRMIISSSGAYACDSIRVEGKCIRTNLPPMNVFSGFGAAQAFFAVEMHAARLAEVAQADPITWKRNNLLKKGGLAVTGLPMRQDADAARLLEKVQEISDFKRKYAAYELQKKRRTNFDLESRATRGIGVSFAYQGTGFHGRGEDREPCTVTVALDGSGKAEIRTSAVPGTNTVSAIWKQTVTDVLGIDEDEVSIAEIDTSQLPDAGPSTLSRNITVVNKLIENCCNTIKRQRFRHPLPIEVQRTFRLPRTITWDAETLSGEPFASRSWGACAVEVEADPVTYETVIRGVWMVLDGGTILRPGQAEKSVEATIYQAFGWAGRERLEYVDGRLSWEDFQSYPTSHPRIPVLAIEFVEPADRSGARGIGELPVSLIPAAYLAAAGQATGRYLDRIPATPDVLSLYMEET